MTKITLTNLVDLQNETTAVNAINNNNAVLVAAMDNTLSRDGTPPNTMSEALDMNSNQIINLPSPLSGSSPLRLTDASILNGGGTIANIPAGGATNGLLTKNSPTDFDVSWKTLVAGLNIAITNQTIATITNPTFSGIITSTNTTSGTSTTAAAILGKSLGLTENLNVGGVMTSGTIVGKGTFAYNSGGQINAFDATDTNKQVWFGFDPSLNMGFVQSIWQAHGFEPLLLNPNGGGISINKTTNSAPLDVTGNGLFSGTLGVTGGSINLSGTTAPQLNFNPASGSTRSAQIVQVGDVLELASGGVAAILNIGLTTNTVSTVGTNSVLSVVGTTASTTSTTGALLVAGGIGAGGQITSGNNIIAGGALLSNNGASGIGYTTGAGGTVTQLTSRTTGVTINKVSGSITMFSAAAVVGTYGQFTVTNSTVAATDTISISVKSTTNVYNVVVTAVAAGSFNLNVASVSGTSTDAPVISFNVIRGVTS